MLCKLMCEAACRRSKTPSTMASMCAATCTGRSSTTSSGTSPGCAPSSGFLSKKLHHGQKRMDTRAHVLHVPEHWSRIDGLHVHVLAYPVLHGRQRRRWAQSAPAVVPQVLEFGLYEFVREEGNPGGVRKIKKGTEVRPHQTHHPLHATCLSPDALVRIALLLGACFGEVILAVCMAPAPSTSGHDWRKQGCYWTSCCPVYCRRSGSGMRRRAPP